MTFFSDFVKNDTPKFNEVLAEGIVYHRFRKAVQYIDGQFKYAANHRTQTHMRYLGNRIIPPEEIVANHFRKRNNKPYDISENTVYPVEFIVHYGDEEEPRKIIMGIPYTKRHGIFVAGGKDLLLMPSLSDKVISIGDRGIFTDTQSAKYTYERIQYRVLENHISKNISVVTTELYKNQTQRLPDSTKAKPTVMHYLLGNFGYEYTMQNLLGFVPTPVYEPEDEAGYVIVKSNGLRPKPWINDETASMPYTPNRICFKVREEDYNANVLYTLGNILYIMDYFPNAIPITDLNDTDSWKRFMGEITHSAHYGIADNMQNMKVHFSDLNQRFDDPTITKLREIGLQLNGEEIQATNVVELLLDIFKYFNRWIASGGSTSLYGTKSLEVETVLLKPITSKIMLMFMNINKDELRNNNQMLEPGQVDKIIKDNMRERAIMSLRSDKRNTAYIDDSTAHSYFKKTAHITNQESDSTSESGAQSNTSARLVLDASMATVGSILYLKKANPIPNIRLNLCANINLETGSVLPDPVMHEIVQKTQDLLDSGRIEFSALMSDNVEELNMNEDDFESGDFQDEELFIEENEFDGID